MILLNDITSLLLANVDLDLGSNSSHGDCRRSGLDRGKLLQQKLGVRNALLGGGGGALLETPKKAAITIAVFEKSKIHNRPPYSKSPKKAFFRDFGFFGVKKGPPPRSGAY